jgi:hypothetical protein
MDYLISMYIDNELSLAEKRIFVEEIHADLGFKDKAVAYLDLERELRSSLVPEEGKAPAAVSSPPQRSRLFAWVRPFPGLAYAAAALVVLAAFYLTFSPAPQNSFHSQPAGSQHRFVLYEADTSQVEIAGSFTGWQRIPMQPAATSGYWEITLEIPPGEHVFSYILDGDTILADPTILTQEADDFGTTNSILVMEAS